MRCRVEHGGRFERAIIQPDLVRLAMFINDIDPGWIRVHNAGLRLLMCVLAKIDALFRLQVSNA